MPPPHFQGQPPEHWLDQGTPLQLRRRALVTQILLLPPMGTQIPPNPPPNLALPPLPWAALGAEVGDPHRIPELRRWLPPHI